MCYKKIISYNNHTGGNVKHFTFLTPQLHWSENLNIESVTLDTQAPDNIIYLRNDGIVPQGIKLISDRILTMCQCISHTTPVFYPYAAGHFFENLMTREAFRKNRYALKELSLDEGKERAVIIIYTEVDLEKLTIQSAISKATARIGFNYHTNDLSQELFLTQQRRLINLITAFNALINLESIDDGIAEYGKLLHEAVRLKKVNVHLINEVLSPLSRKALFTYFKSKKIPMICRQSSKGSAFVAARTRDKDDFYLSIKSLHDPHALINQWQLDPKTRISSRELCDFLYL